MQAIRVRAEAPSKLLQKLVVLLAQFIAAPGALPILSASGASDLVCALLRTHIDNAELVGFCCATLTRMVMQHGYDVPVEAADLAELAVRTHLVDSLVQWHAKHLVKLLAPSAAPSGMAVSPERAALARVEHFKAHRDFASLVNNMDAFPELEELQRAGCVAISEMLEDGSREVLVTAGVVECVVRALDLFRHSAETQGYSLNALQKLVTASKELASVAGNAGAVRLAVRVLRSFPEDAGVIAVAFCVLAEVAISPRFCEEALGLNAVVLCAAALRRCAKNIKAQAGACGCLARLCQFDDQHAVAFDALSMGAMELAVAALRNHRSSLGVGGNASGLLYVVCFDESTAVKAKQLGVPALLQATLKAHPSDANVQTNASAALARIKHFVDAASARAEANMADLIAGEEAAKGGKGGAAAAKKVGKGKGKGGKEGAAGPLAFPPPPPPVAADGEPSLTKAQLKRRKAKVAAAVRKAAAASGSTAGEEEEEVEGSDASSADVELPRSRPPLDFSKDSEFRRSLKLPPRDVEAEIDAIIAQQEALLSLGREAQTSNVGTASPAPTGVADEPDALTLSEPPLRETRADETPHLHPLRSAPFTDTPFPSAAPPSPPKVIGRAPAAGDDHDVLRADNSRLRGEVASLQAELTRMQCEVAARDAALASRDADLATLRAAMSALRVSQ